MLADLKYLSRMKELEAQLDESFQEKVLGAKRKKIGRKGKEENITEGKKERKAEAAEEEGQQKRRKKSNKRRKRIERRKQNLFRRRRRKHKKE